MKLNPHNKRAVYAPALVRTLVVVVELGVCVQSDFTTPYAQL